MKDPRPGSGAAGRILLLLATLTSAAACTGGAATADLGSWGTGNSPVVAPADGGTTGTSTDGPLADGTGGSGGDDTTTEGSGGSATDGNSDDRPPDLLGDLPGVPDVGVPDVGAPDVGAPDAKAPDTAGPDTSVPDVVVADVGVPDTAVPDAAVPDAAVPPLGACPIPVAAQAADSTHPTTVVGQGTPASCTSDAFVAAVAKGGVITFDCGPAPITIALDQTAKVFNNKGPEIVIDGGGKVTLSGRNARRILYQNTCDPAQTYTTPRCDNQDHPRLTVQNLTFVDGNAKGEKFRGGGAIYAQGGRLKLVNTRFFHNVCDSEGPDVGGGAVRAFQQFDGQPLYVVGSTFGGPGDLGNEGANGGALSAIGVSYSILNSVFEGNRAIGEGGNPAVPGTPGGGSGGAIYNDGNTFTLSLCGTRVQNNRGRQFGGAIFFVSNDRSGSLIIRDSVLRNNVSEDRVADQFPGIFVLARARPDFINSTVE